VLRIVRRIVRWKRQRGRYPTIRAQREDYCSSGAGAVGLVKSKEGNRRLMSG
jgi:hypothetical protein